MICKAVYQRGSYNPQTGTAVCDTCGKTMPCPQPGQMPEHDGAQQPEQQQHLPPQAVAGIDARLAHCDPALKALIAKYRTIAASHGTAAATGVIAGDLYSTQLRGLSNVVDVLAYAISLLADK